MSKELMSSQGGGRALALAGIDIHASNSWGMPCTLGQSRLKYTELTSRSAVDHLPVLQ